MVASRHAGTVWRGDLLRLLASGLTAAAPNPFGFRFEPVAAPLRPAAEIDEDRDDRPSGKPLDDPGPAAVAVSQVEVPFLVPTLFEPFPPVEPGKLYPPPDPNQPPPEPPAAPTPAREPLLPWPKLHRTLRRLLAAERPTREIDVPVVVRRLERGEPLGEPPRKRRRALARRVWVIEDRDPGLAPFFDDMDDVARRLTRLLGATHVRIWTLRGDPRDTATCVAVGRDGYVARGPRRRLGVGRGLPEAGVPVLALSDLGAYETRLRVERARAERSELSDARLREMSRARTSESWRALGARLRLAGCATAVLAPVPRSMGPLLLGCAWSPVAWDRSAPSPDVATALAEAGEPLLHALAPVVDIEPRYLRWVRRRLTAVGADASWEYAAWRRAEPGSVAVFSRQPPTADADRRLGVWTTNDFGGGPAFASALRRSVAEFLWSALRTEEKPQVRWLAVLSAASADPDAVPAERVAFVRRCLLDALRAAFVEGVHEPFLWRESQRARSLIADERLRRHYGVAFVKQGLEDEPAMPMTGLKPPEIEALRGEAPVPTPWTAVHGPRGVVFERFIPRAPEAKPAEGSRLWLGHVGSRIQATDAAGRPFARELLAPKVEPLPDGTERLTLEADEGRWTFGAVTKARWMDELGRDAFGLYCDVAVRNVSFRMRWIPPGRFRFGSPMDEPGRFPWEFDSRDVDLTTGYWLADSACTQALWQAVVRSDERQRFADPDRPVVEVSWDDVHRVFLPSLDLALREEFGDDLYPDGHFFRLPTEAEWERACRAGTSDATYAGPIEILGQNNAPILDSIAWYGGNSGRDLEATVTDAVDSADWNGKQYDHARAAVRKVRGKAANGFGLYDMLGNVDEWCSDGWTQDADAPSDAVDPWEPPNERVHRVIRGGSWLSDARRCRAACRGGLSPELRWDGLGFRLARGRTPSPASKQAGPPAGGERAPRDEARRGTSRPSRGAPGAAE